MCVCKTLKFSITVYLFWCIIDKVKGIEDLEFWTPQPQMRRAQENKNNYNFKSDGTQHRYNLLKPINKEEQLSIGHHNVRHRTGDNEERDMIKKKWPNVNKNARQKRRKEILRVSTRMVPLYQMQQAEDHAEAVNPKEEEEPENISPFSIAESMSRLASSFPEANITVQVLGRTIEYNDIVILKITELKSDIDKYFRADDDKYIDELPEKKIVFIVHGLSVMGFRAIPYLSQEKEFKKLLSYYIAYLDKFDIFIIPMANPDGVARPVNEHGMKVLWNKNVSPQSACLGVALDRNFDVAWNTSRSINPCSQLYPGPSPFSETETRVVRDILQHFGHKIVAYLHVHGGTFTEEFFKGDAVLYPKGYTDVQSDDDKYIDLKGDIDEAMKNASFQQMSVTVDSLYGWYGKVSGASVDYAATVFGIPYALELVMQVYEGKEVNDAALTVIWKRIIDVIFNNIWKNTHGTDTK